MWLSFAGSTKPPESSRLNFELRTLNYELYTLNYELCTLNFEL